MSTSAFILGLALGIAGVIAISYLSYFAGYKRGKDAGWIEHYFDTVAKDLGRCGSNGQFKSPPKNPTP